MRESMGNETCRGYEGCKATLCPLDNSFNQAVWYADEPICSIRGAYRKEKWRKNQRRIAKINSKNPVEGYFTVEYLANLGRVTTKVHGIISGSITESHKFKPLPERPKRVLTPEHLAKLREGRAKARAK